jgi:3-deoxy-D-manno-octulosonic acid kinase
MKTLSTPPLPSGYLEIRSAGTGATAWVRNDTENVTWVREQFDAGLSLYEAARAAADGRPAFHGRRPVFTMQSESADGEWVVKRYARGGLVASHLGDRFFRVFARRPFLEAAVSEQVRAAGILTPRVLAAAVYPSGLIYRGDLITRRVPSSRDMASILFGADGRPAEPGPDAKRIEVLREAGRLVRLLAQHGIRHPDLNARNLLFQEPGRGGLHLLDLDRCRIDPRDPDRLRERLSRRLHRSLVSWERRSGLQLAEEEWAALKTGLTHGDP